MKRKIYPLVIIVLLTLFSCGNNPPELKQIRKQINYIYLVDKEKIETEVSFVLNAKDEDGDEDLEAIYIINDKNQVYWQLEKQDWLIREVLGIKWIGFNHLKNIKGIKPYTGNYRILIIDQAGERDETYFFLPPIKSFPEKKDFPKIKKTKHNDCIEVISKNRNNIITFYDKEMNIIETISATPGFLYLDMISNKSVQSDCEYITISTYSNIFGGGLFYKGFSLE